MPAILMTLYGVVSYAFFFVTFLFLVGFVGDLPLPLVKTIDGGPPGPLGMAVLVNLLLVTLFGLQHSVMARPAFKRWWTRLVPEPIERSTYVLAATTVLALMMALWQPMPEPLVWSVEPGLGAMALEALFWAGWAVLLLATFLINHFELFGLRQVFARLFRRSLPAPRFSTPLLYRHVRHPIYLGFLISFWATPRMTAGHLLFAGAMTVYIFIGIAFEERDLIAHFGERYRLYREQVGMLLPWPGRRARRGPASE